MVPAPFQPQRRRLLRLRPQRELVAGRHVDGGHDVCRRHAAGRHRPGLHAGHLRELAVVGPSVLGHDDGVSLRPAVAALRSAHRCAVRRDSLLRQACGLSARLSRHLSWPADELRHPRLGDQSDDQHCRHHAGQHSHAGEHQPLHERTFWLGVERQRWRGAGHLRLLPDSRSPDCTSRWAVCGACCGPTFSSSC